MDLFVPWTYMHPGRRKRSLRQTPRKNLVPACRECNNIAGNKVFERLEDKREYIQGRLSIKYKRIIDLPHWSEKELNGLGYGIRAGLKIKLLARKWVMNRINYPYITFDITTTEESLQEIMLILTK